jgi:tetratricopeptide (TPR) repeat protein
MSPSVADNRNNLATVAYQEGDSIAAERYYVANLAVDEKVLGPNHPDLAITLNNIGRLQLERRAFSAAQASLARAVAISLPERGLLHDEMAFQFANLAMAEQGLGRLTKAEALFVKALAAGRRNKHRNVGPILVDLANVHCQSKRTGSGLAMLVEAVPLIQLDYPDDPWRMAWVWSVKGECLINARNAAAGAQAIRESAAPVLRRWPEGSYYAAEISRRLMLAAAADKTPAGQPSAGPVEGQPAKSIV